jgi:hypothetical protein
VISGDFRDLPFDEFTIIVKEQVAVEFVYKKEWTRDLRITASGDNLDLYKVLSDQLSRKDLYFVSRGRRIFITRNHQLVAVLPDYAGINEETGLASDSLAIRDLTEAEKLYIEGRRKSSTKTIYVGNSADHINGQGAVINGIIKDIETDCLYPPGFLYIPF